MSTKVNPTIQTKWGKADVWNTGYYTISDNSKGHYRELLHRLIFEEVHKCTLLSKSVIHHIDGNKTNNNSDNLELMSKNEHARLHTVGRKIPDSFKEKMSRIHKNKKQSEETKKKISQAKKGVKLSKSAGINMSKNKNTTGFYCVSTKPCSKCNIGFSWIYQYYDENLKKKVIHSVDLLKLKRRVLERDLLWQVMDITNAKSTAEKYGYDLEDLM